MHEQKEILAILRKIDYLQGLEEEVLAELAARSLWREYAPGAVIFLEGEAGRGLYYLQFGWVKAIKSSPEGREQVLHILAPGETFNEISLFTGRPNAATAVALEAAGVWLIPRDAVREILDSRPHMAAAIVDYLAGRMVDLVALVADLSLRPVEGRLARLLLNEAVDGIMARKQWATQAELAARLGTVPDVLSRAMRTLAARGLISFDRQEIRLLDRQALVDMAMIDGG